MQGVDNKPHLLGKGIDSANKAGGTPGFATNRSTSVEKFPKNAANDELGKEATNLKETGFFWLVETALYCICVACIT